MTLLEGPGSGAASVSTDAAPAGPPPRWSVSVVGEDRTFRCPADQTVLRHMASLGLHHLPIGCRGGGCGVCRVKVLSGDYDTGRMSRRHVSEQEANDGLALSCRVYPRSDLVVEHDESPNAKTTPGPTQAVTPFRWPGLSGPATQPEGADSGPPPAQGEPGSPLSNIERRSTREIDDKQEESE